MSHDRKADPANQPTAFRRLLDAMEDWERRPAEQRSPMYQELTIIAARAALMVEWYNSAAVRHRFPHSLVEAKGLPSWQRLHGHYGPAYAMLPADAHVTMWRQPSDRGARISLWVSQPYGLTADDLTKMHAAAQERDLEFDVSTWPAWHNPGHVLFVNWRAKP